MPTQSAFALFAISSKAAQDHKTESKLKAEMAAAAGDEATKEKLSFLWVDPATAPLARPAETCATTWNPMKWCIMGDW